MGQKSKNVFICSECGYESPKWAGKCPQCNQWNTLNEEVVQVVSKASTSTKKVSMSNVEVSSVKQISSTDEIRYKTKISELDRVLGGGLVKGSVVLLSGDPGIGKSTLLMQMCGSLSKNCNILYVSGEESSRQLKMRAERLDVLSDNVNIMTETDVEVVREYINTNKPDIVMVDSIQTMSLDGISSSVGSVTQVRECTNVLLRTGKALDIPIIIVGHVNKDGAIAGPKVLEHIVDAVLYFEGERNYSYRILRAVKNRFGSTNEIGVFEMLDSGLKEVDNPSSAMLAGRAKNVSGSCITCAIEGSRPILAEVQSLVTPTGFGNPRRMSTGFDYNRLNLILAVLEKRMGLRFSAMDCYLNIVGGLKIDEPASDLSVAISLVSGLKDKIISEDIVAFGEIGLAGEIRSVPRIQMRIQEAVRLGFKTCIVPRLSLKQLSKSVPDDINLIPVRNLAEVFANIF